MTAPGALRVLHVLASPGPGGAEILTRDLAAEMRARGHVMAIAFISHAAEVGNSPVFEACFKDQLEHASVSILHIGHASRRNPIHGAWKLHTAIRCFRPDVLHIHLQWGLLFRLLLSPIASSQLVTVYTHHINTFRNGARLFKLLAGPVDGLVAISEVNRRLLEEHATCPVRYIPNAVAFPVPCRDRYAGDATGVFRVLSAGQLHPQKDYQTLIEAAFLIFSRRPELAGKLVFQIAGDGPERGQLEALISERGLVGKVVLLGTRTDVPELMCQSDLLLMTSAYEGLPITLLEALHAGLPIVATKVGGVPQVVGHGDNGFLAPPGATEQIAGYVWALVNDRSLAQRFSARSVKRAAHYSIAQSADRHVDFYRQLLAQRRLESNLL